jgi:hypothetical protein
MSQSKKVSVSDKELQEYHQGLLSNYWDLRRSQWWKYHEEIAEAAERAVKAGGEAPLEFVGIGMYGVVLCDQHHAYKVSRGKNPRFLGDEAEWLATASQIREVRPHIATFVDWDKGLGVITRECVQGRPGGWGAADKVRAVFSKIEPHMLAAGWGMPEFKEDSVVFDEAGRGKLVDAGSANRISNRLASYIESVIAKKRPQGESHFEERIQDLAWQLQRELSENPKAIAQGRLEPPLDDRRARSILEKLYAMGASRS